MNAINIIELSKIKLINVACIMSLTVTSSYSVYYWLGLERIDVAIFNFVFIAGYCSPLLFLRYQKLEQATLSLLIVLMSHLFIYTYYLFSPDSGFHLYYLLVPSIVFLLLDENSQRLKLFFTFLSTILFVLCATTPQSPLVAVPELVNKYFFISSVIVITIEIYLVFHFYSQTINQQATALKLMASIDPLTKLNNRLHFDNISQVIFENAKRSGNKFSVLLIDIDWFKKVNDTHGHIVGDMTLITVANTLKEQLRSGDCVARYGGEEFIILLPNTNKNEAVVVASKLNKEVEELVINVKNVNLSCTISIGVAEFTSCHNSLLEVIDHADQALYQAKDTGRNKVAVYSS